MSDPSGYSCANLQKQVLAAVLPDDEALTGAPLLSKPIASARLLMMVGEMVRGSA
jgi:hypothetical protein